ncbi:transposase family protein [Streptomyces liangshanensis]|uniref:Transposase family protein n=1 Tax=Streptomyces liangshanensis TaxID=2717324 RepID=A0A6G9GZA0_9ACTN|nr:transposase family protein [Streptomyces liangshanensis]
MTKSSIRQHPADRPAGADRLPTLADRRRTLADPRCRPGRRHPLVAAMPVACSAVVTGVKSFAAIGKWAERAPQDTLARLGTRTATAFTLCVAPSGVTIRRVVQRTCPGGPADPPGCDPAGSDTLTVDGKSARGSRLGTTPAAHLLAAMTGGGRTVYPAAGAGQEE